MNGTHQVRSGRRRFFGSAPAVAAIVALAGCSGEDVAERLIEERVERESGGDVDIDVDGGNIRIETEDGTFEMSSDGDGNISIDGEGADGEISIDSEDGVTVIESDEGNAVISSGGAGVPDDFPASVPLPDGFDPDFTQSMASDQGDGWILGGPIDATPAEVAESYLAALESAGFEQLQMTETQGSLFFAFDDGEYSVSGLAGDDGSGETYVNITVLDSQM